MSHFPSIEDFDEGITVPMSSGPIDGENALKNLETAALGADADLFASGGSQFPALDDDDLLGGVDAPGHKFESTFPDLIGGNEAIGPGGTITGSTAPYIPGAVSTNFPSSSLPEEEPEVIKQWRERQQLEIQRRDELSESRKKEVVAKAETALDDFYDNYNNKKERSIQSTRKEAEEFLANRENTSAGGTSWERIAKLVDLSDKAVKAGKSDKSRFRELLVSLRKDEQAPGANGL